MTDLKEVAIRRLEILTEEFHLNPTILNRFKKDGTVSYSYMTGFLSPSIDVISYQPQYEEQVSVYQKMTGFLVYHAIERYEHEHRILSLLFVDPLKTGDYQWRFDDWLVTFDYDVELDENSYNLVRVGASKPAGALFAIPKFEC